MARSSPRRRGAASAEAARQRSLLLYLSQRPNWSTEVLFVFPLFVVYQAGTFSSNQLNGVDLVSTLLFRLSSVSEYALLGLASAVMVGVGYLYWRMRRRERFELRMILPVLAESAVYAVLMGTVILFVMNRILGIAPPSLGAGSGYGPWMVVYVSAGAGLHEELVFRVAIYGGLAALLGSRTGLSRLVVVGLALAVSATLFSVSHHIPPHGEPFTLFAFVYRLLAGVIFGVLYAYRGFSTAVYTHFLYDVLVLGLFRG
ncbi:MAG: CPBP family intramembrane glutamic endopeptidase [bacterium]